MGCLEKYLDDYGVKFERWRQTARYMSTCELLWRLYGLAFLLGRGRLSGKNPPGSGLGSFGNEFW